MSESAAQSQFPHPEMQEIGKPPRCSESSQEGARCIYDERHKGKHFAKDAFSYYSWRSRSPAATSVDVRLIRDGRFMWGWVVSVGVETVASDLIPRFSEKSARRAAERAARHWARRGAPRQRRYSVDV